MTRVDRTELLAFAEAIIAAEGAPERIATTVADSLVTADIRGHTSHGTRRLAGKYRREVESGRIQPAAEPEVGCVGDTWIQIDGNMAYGQLVGRVATDAVVEMAQEIGVAVATLKQTSHIGRVGEFAEKAAREGMVFTAYVCNPGNALVAPAGSAQRRFSTNPIAFGVPTFGGLDFEFVMDIATSQVAHGKVTAAAVRGDAVPKTWLVDDDARPITDPSRFEDDEAGAMLPLGGQSAGYKGYNLAVMSELMAANLTDGTVSGGDDQIWGNHAVFTALDIERFTSRERAAERARTIAKYIRSSDFSFSPGDATKGDETLLPGEYEYKQERDHIANGVEIADIDARRLTDVARDLGVDVAIIPEAFLSV